MTETFADVDVVDLGFFSFFSNTTEFTKLKQKSDLPISWLGSLATIDFETLWPAGHLHFEKHGFYLIVCITEFSPATVGGIERKLIHVT